MATQLQIAQTGAISDEVKYVAKAGNVGIELIREELAVGRLVIPANKLHLKANLKACGVGRLLSTKVNANIGTSSMITFYKGKCKYRHEQYSQLGRR